ncbi:FAD-dependent oxidoreductase, partial [Oleiphilus sp. HI0117]
MSSSYTYDVLIIGSGAAGLSAALGLNKDLSVAVISKAGLSSGSTPWAQGGIAAVLSEKDDIESHIRDTLNAGAGLCHEDAVRQTVENGRQSVSWLVDQGVDFTKMDNAEEDTYHLTKEGGHSHRRVIHADDATGLAISTALCSQAELAENIDIFENRVAVDLITHKKLFLPGNRCVGAYVLNQSSDHVELFKA